MQPLEIHPVSGLPEIEKNCNLAEMFKNVVSVSKAVLCDGGMVVPYIGVEHVVISGK